MKKRTVALLLALVLCAGCAVGGTVAWLMDTTETVVNTFTTSDITITLTEATGTEYKMVPGATFTKDPKVTVAATSEDCWLFVKLEKSATTYTVNGVNKGFDDFLSYEIDNNWTALSGEPGVYYINNPTKNTAISVIAGDKMTVKNTVTKEMMAAVDSHYPTLSVTAYAIQSAHLTDSNADSIVDAKDAWELVKENPANPGVSGS